VEFRLRELVTAEQLVSLLDGTLDVGFLRDGEPREGLAIEPILREPFMAVLPSRHRLAAKAVTRRISGSRVCSEDHDIGSDFQKSAIEALDLDRHWDESETRQSGGRAFPENCTAAVRWVSETNCADRHLVESGPYLLTTGSSNLGLKPQAQGYRKRCRQLRPFGFGKLAALGHRPPGFRPEIHFRNTNHSNFREW
jgi:hypothetical protein